MNSTPLVRIRTRSGRSTPDAGMNPRRCTSPRLVASRCEKPSPKTRGQGREAWPYLLQDGRSPLTWTSGDARRVCVTCNKRQGGRGWLSPLTSGAVLHAAQHDGTAQGAARVERSAQATKTPSLRSRPAQTPVHGHTRARTRADEDQGARGQAGGLPATSASPDSPARDPARDQLWRGG